MAKDELDERGLTPQEAKRCKHPERRMGRGGGYSQCPRCGFIGVLISVALTTPRSQWGQA